MTSPPIMMSDKEETTAPSTETSQGVASTLETVKEDSRVLLLAQDGSYMLHRMTLGTLVRISRKRIKCDPIVGAPYGSVFRLVGNQLRRVENAHVDEASKHSGMLYLPIYLPSYLPNYDSKKLEKQFDRFDFVFDCRY